MPEEKKNEVTISKSTPLPKDKVFFPGTAVVSDKEAAALEQAEADRTAAAAAPEEEAPAPKKKTK